MCAPVERGGEHFKFNSDLSTYSIFSYNGEYATKMVGIYTCVVTRSDVNTDRKFHPSEEATARLTVTYNADAKFRKNNKLLSIGSKINNAKVRVQRMELKHLNLFVRNHSEKQGHVNYEFSKQSRT